MPAAIKPYSIAVAPFSSLRNATNFNIRNAPCQHWSRHYVPGALKKRSENTDKISARTPAIGR
jgi:hypothetical protein